MLETDDRISEAASAEGILQKTTKANQDDSFTLVGEKENMQDDSGD